MYSLYVLAALAALFWNIEIVWGAAINTSSRQTELQSSSCIVGLSKFFLLFSKCSMVHYSRHDRRYDEYPRAEMLIRDDTAGWT